MLWTTALGYVAVSFIVGSFLIKNPRHTALCQSVGEGLFFVYFALLGQPIMAFICLGAMGRNLVTTFLSLRVLQVYFTTFLTATWCLCIFYAESYMDLFPAAGVTLSTVAMMFRDSFWHFRLSSLVSQVLWMALFISQGWLPSILQVTITTSMNLYKMARVYMEEGRGASVVLPFRAPVPLRLRRHVA